MLLPAYAGELIFTVVLRGVPPRTYARERIFHEFVENGDDAEGDRIRKFAQVQARDPLDLVEAVHQRVAVHIQVARSFADVEGIFQKFFGGVDHVLVFEKFARVPVQQNGEVRGKLCLEHVSQHTDEHKLAVAVYVAL